MQVIKYKDHYRVSKRQLDKEEHLWLLDEDFLLGISSNRPSKAMEYATIEAALVGIKEYEQYRDFTEKLIWENKLR